MRSGNTTARRRRKGGREEARKAGTKGGREEGRQGGRRQLTLKSNNPHLAGGEKTMKYIIVLDLVFFNETPAWDQSLHALFSGGGGKTVSSSTVGDHLF